MMLEHGESQLFYNEQVLLYAGRGPWNEEAMLPSLQKTIEHLNQFPQQRPWAQLSCLFGESLMSPSVFNVFVDYCHLRKKNGLVFTAISIQDSEIKNTIKQQLTSAYRLTNIDFEFFDSISDAQKCLQEKGFYIDNDELHSFLKACKFAPTDYI